jgi:Flp pilus assembly protein CpaB
MSSRSIMMLVLAIIFSVTTSLGLYSLLSGKDGTNSKGRVVVAKVNLARGVMVTADQVELRSIDRSHIPSGAITRIEDSLERAVFIPLLEGES